MKLIIPILLNCMLVLSIYLADKYTPAKKLPYMGKQIIINPKIKSILPHEISTALALAKAGYKVEFIATNSSIKRK